MLQSEQRKIAKTPRSRSFKEDDWKTLNEILKTVESFKNKIEELRNELKTSKQEIEHVKIDVTFMSKGRVPMRSTGSVEQPIELPEVDKVVEKST